MELSDGETLDVLACHRKFDLPIGDKGPKIFSKKDVQKRVDFIQEEFEELQEAWDLNDLPKFVDALIDMVYVIKGTAVMAGITPAAWADAWDEVHSANMRKEKSNADNYHFGLRKPQGWIPPDIAGVLKRYSK